MVNYLDYLDKRIFIFNNLSILIFILVIKKIIIKKSKI